MDDGTMTHGAWIQTFSGTAFDPLNPRIDDIRIEDIAHALAMQCRYSGHTREFYSVAEHSVRAYWLCGLPGLLHDATEAYLHDLPRPLKLLPEFAFYRDAEKRLERMVEQRFGLEPGALSSPRVKQVDTLLLATEKRDLMGEEPAPWMKLPEPLPVIIRPWSWTRAENEFHDAFEACT